MGKKSLTKSTTTTKKNTASKKKNVKKKQNDEEVGKNTKAKSKESKKTPRKPTLKSLRKRKFEGWSSKSTYVPEPDSATEKIFTAPELIADYDPADAEKIRTLIFRQINLSTPEPGKEKPEAVQEPAGTGTDETEAGEKPESKQPSDSSGEKPPGPPQGPPGGGGKSQPPISLGMLGLIGAIALIFALIISASINNTDNYYLKQTNKGLEIWRGEFSPSGREKIVTLRGWEASKPLKEEYSREEAFKPAFDYFMEKADTVAETRDLPDLSAIRDNLNKAKQYAITEEQKELVNRRLDRIDFLMLLYRADVAAEKQTAQGYEKAMDLLEQAEELELAEGDKQRLQQRISQARQKLEKLQEEPGNTDGNK